MTLAEQLTPALHVVARRVSDGGDTVKYLWELHDGKRIETVLMVYPDRVTVCISSQVGCAMGCGFCATGQAGFTRHLTVGEIVEQVAMAAREARSMHRRLGNVVFMGMGEPLANETVVWESVERMHTDIGLSARKLTISTVGLVPGIRRLTERPLPVNLAVSLHAANDRLRDELVPINKRYPIDGLMAACADYLAVKGRRLSFEWAMIDGVNDRPGDAAELATLCRQFRLPAHVNLIPLNPTPGYPTVGSPLRRVHEFRDTLESLECQRDSAPKSGHRHRCRLWPVGRRSTGDDRPVTVTSGTWGWRLPACRELIARPRRAPRQADRRTHLP